MVILQGTGLYPQLNQIEEVRRNWGGFLALGILLIILGIIVLISAEFASIFTVFLFGIFLIIAGIIQGIQAFMAYRWSGLFLSLLLGILYIVTGVLCVTNPVGSALSITMLIGILCLIGGIFKIVSSLILRFDQWGWVFFNGIVTFILGLLIYSEWPVSGLWVIGTFIGVDLILSGWSWVLLSFTARRTT